MQNNSRNYTIVKLDSVAPSDAIVLLKAAFGERFTSHSFEKVWHWRHNENPAGHSLGTACLSATQELVGLRPFMFFRLAAGDDQLLAARAGDTAVHPDYQRRGLFSSLTRKGVNNLRRAGVHLIFNTPNEKSGPGYKKLGWTLLGHPVVWVKINKPLSALYQFLFHRKTTVEIEAHSYGASVSEGLESLLSLVPLNQKEKRIHLEKSPCYLRWRYDDHPVHCYRLTTDMGAKGTEFIDSPRCVLVSRPDRRGPVRGLAVVEQFYSSIASYRRALRKLSQEVDADYVLLAGVRSMSEIAGLLANGFMPLKWRNVNLAVNVLDDGVLPKCPLKMKNWYLSLGDLEAF